MIETHKYCASCIQNICELILVQSSNANHCYYLHVMMGELRYRKLVSKECAVSQEIEHAS